MVKAADDDAKDPTSFIENMKSVFAGAKDGSVVIT